ncbi:MAG TPA: aromatic ring-hydroxylating dioxygenase subunit alpha, partial [Candidatus Aquilonibacter sp.]
MSAFVKAGVPLGAKTLEGHWYTSPDVFAREQEAIFSRDWICVGREESLPAPGDYVLAQIAGESVIVVRDGSGALHALFNVCRHRGTRICESSSGHFTGAIQCPYHAWTYALDGRLMVARNMDDLPGFDANVYPLQRAELAIWEGFIFVNISKLAEPFDAVYAPVYERFARWGIARLRSAATLHYTLDCNWKLIFQNYSECYHCPLVHPQLEKLSP